MPSHIQIAFTTAVFVCAHIAFPADAYSDGVFGGNLQAPLVSGGHQVFDTNIAGAAGSYDAGQLATGPEYLTAYGNGLNQPYHQQIFSGAGGNSINAAIVSEHYVNAVPARSSGGFGKPTHVEVSPGIAPIVFSINSRSSPLITLHKHFGMNGSFKKTYSYDKPHKMVHVVRKPVIHELKEIIMPYRHHLQQVKPVKHNIKTLVHQQGKHFVPFY